MNWWQRTQEKPLKARLAAAPDRPALADLLARTRRRHGPLALEDQIALLNSGVSSLAVAGDEVVGFLGLQMRAPADVAPTLNETLALSVSAAKAQEHWADVMMAAVAPGWGAGRTLVALLDAALPALRPRGITALVCLTDNDWLADALLQARFAETDRVVMYTRQHRGLLPAVRPVALLRRAGPAEADTVLELNAAVFPPLWRYDPAVTLSWLLTADHAILAERAGRPVGFALTNRATGNECAQLIRLAVHPVAQSQGIGRQLVVDALTYAWQHGAPGLTLNTQASNTPSRRLYESLGFRLTGSSVTVMVYVMSNE
jgi:ribosomal protein S18 acetylase RimI-like enzyme